MNLKSIVFDFITETNIETTALGNGHINETYLVKSGESKYVLQKINKSVFKNPHELMENIKAVNEYLCGIVKDERAYLHFLPQRKSGRFYTIDGEGDYWRMYRFVPRSLCIDYPDEKELFECGRGFGNFQRMLCDFDAQKLFCTIPDFHNTPKRFAAFLSAVSEDSLGRAAEAAAEIEFFKAREEYYSTLLNAEKSGKLSLRVSHNDTKCNNVLLDEKDKTALCVIDLDTIMPGYSVTDFGDAVRFGASTAAEDEKDTDKIALDIDRYRAYTRGFLFGCGGKLPESELELLPDGAIMMTLECGMRFLTDYLSGDTYFKTAFKGHNLVRARAQIALAADMERRKELMQSIIKEII